MGAAYGAADALGPASAYVHDLRSLVQGAVLGGVALVALAAVAVPVARRWDPSRPPPAWVGTTAAAVVAVVAGLGTRPLWHTGHGIGSVGRFVESLQQAPGLPVDGERNYYEQSVHWVSWYAGWPALVLAAAAAVLLVRQAVLRRDDLVSGRPAARWVLGIGLPFVSALSVLWSPGITPDHPWADRRLVPTVLPVVALLAVWTVAACSPGAGAPARWWSGWRCCWCRRCWRPLPRPEPDRGRRTGGGGHCVRRVRAGRGGAAGGRAQPAGVDRGAAGGLDVPAFGVPGDGTDDVAPRPRSATSRPGSARAAAPRCSSPSPASRCRG